MKIFGGSLNDSVRFQFVRVIFLSLDTHVTMLSVQVVNKWLALQAMSDVAGNVEHVRSLLEHPAFDIRNPNKVCFHGSVCFIPAGLSFCLCMLHVDLVLF